MSPARAQLQHQYTIAFGAELPSAAYNPLQSNGSSNAITTSDKQALLAAAAATANGSGGNGSGSGGSAMTLQPSGKSSSSYLKQQAAAAACDLHLHSTQWPSSSHHALSGTSLAAQVAATTAATTANAPIVAKKRNVNFCRAWLNKFPSRSKRIDVISRIFFPKMFALFNLVYWTTYLFREDDIARS